MNYLSIRENTEFPLDAILNEESNLSPAQGNLADFRCPATWLG